MGFGFVNFESNSNASAALEALNGMDLREGKVMKVSVARPAWKANIHSNLYISGFPFSFSETDLMDLFGVHANNVESVRLLRDSDKKPRGAAVVRMSSEEAASSVISAINGVPFKKGSSSSIIQVRPWRPEFRAERVSDENISDNLESRRSDPKSFNFHAHQHRDQSGVYRPEIDAQKLLDQMTSKYSRNRGLLPIPMTTPETLETDDDEDVLATLFIFHLPQDVPETVLEQMFSQFGGAIESVQLMPSKGYGFVSYFRSSDAVVAMNHLNGFLFPGSKKPIRIELKH